MEPYNRYVRLLPEHRTVGVRIASESLERALSLKEAAYCYPTSAVPPEALARHLVRIVTSPSGEVYGPLSDVPILKISACNSIEQNGVAVCYVCQACSTPGDPLPQDHWEACPRFDEDLQKRAVSLFGRADEAAVARTRKRYAAYAALRSVSSETRQACLRLLALEAAGRDPEFGVFANEGERRAWVEESPAVMPHLEEMLRMNAHEASEMVRRFSMDSQAAARHAGSVSYKRPRLLPPTKSGSASTGFSRASGYESGVLRVE